MFAYIPFGSSKSAHPGELKNDLAYSSNLDGAWRLSIYIRMCARLIEKDNEKKTTREFGKAWKRIFVGRKFCNAFVLIRDSGLCLFVKKSLQRINPSLGQGNCIKASGS